MNDTGVDMERSEKDVMEAGIAAAPTIGGANGLLTPGEVARLFGVDPKTVSRWADAGKIEALRTLGGHRRYRADEIAALLETE